MVKREDKKGLLDLPSSWMTKISKPSCTRCGKPKAADRFKMCADCRAIARSSKQVQREDPVKLAQHAEREAIRRAEMTVEDKAQAVRRHQLAGRYNLTQGEWDLIWEAQGFACATCGRKPSPYAKRRYHTDHRHSDGLVRGILCRFCNQALGNVKDSVAVLAALQHYLESPPATEVLGAERFTEPGPVYTKKRKRRRKR